MPTFLKVVCKSGLLSFCLIEPLGKCEGDKESDKINYKKSTPKLNDGGKAQMVEKGIAKQRPVRTSVGYQE